MIKLHSYKMISEGKCSHCKQPYLEWKNNEGWVCKQCGYVYLLDTKRKLVIEPDCQREY